MDAVVTTPPPVALQISDVVIRDSATGAVAPVPITTTGAYFVDATVIGTPTWTHIIWQQVDSRAPNDTITTITYAPGARIIFHAYFGDSYNRTFLIRPASNDSIAPADIRNIPVCVTGGNQNFSRSGSSKKGGVVPNAVGGCY